MAAQNIEKRTKPCVPTPDWSTSFNEMEVDNKQKGGNNNLQDITMNSTSVTPTHCKAGVSSKIAAYSKPSSSQTPDYSKPSCSSQTPDDSEPSCSSQTLAYSEPSCSSRTPAYCKAGGSSKTAAYSKPSGSSQTPDYCEPSCSSQTPAYHEPGCSSQTTPAMATSHSYIAGEVALTPTHSTFTPQTINPHSAMTAMTPMASGTDQAKNSITVQNCVSTVNLGCELKLLDVYCKTRFSEYNPARFHGVVMKIVDPRATALVFRSGKILCTGLRSEHDSYMAARKFARVIQKLGYPAKFLGFKIQNLIATADLRFPIRLEALQQAHGQFASYEPELFPGLVYRMVRPRVVLLIFVNGKIVFTGGKSRSEINDALDIIYPILRSYRIS